MSEISDAVIKVKRNLSLFLQNKTCYSERQDVGNNRGFVIGWYW